MTQYNVSVTLLSFYEATAGELVSGDGCSISSCVAGLISVVTVFIP